MIIFDTTMFVIPSIFGFYPGLAVNLNLESPIVSFLLEKGFDRGAVCKAFRELFSKIPSEIISKEIPQERKWWQFYKSKSKIVYEDNNLSYKLRVLSFINEGKALEEGDIEKIKALYLTLSPEIRKVIPLELFLSC